MNRISKENYYLNIAQTVLERATCLRRVYGAIIVKNDEIISTGYNGSPRGRKNCVDMGFCTREAMQVPRGERYELCRSVHAEANANRRRKSKPYIHRKPRLKIQTLDSKRLRLMERKPTKNRRNRNNK